MATAAQLKASIDQFVDKSAAWAYAIVNGGPTETVETDSGTIKTFSKAIADFENDNNYVRHDIAQAVPVANYPQFWANLGVNGYATLELANTGEANHNVLFYNTTLDKLQMTTSNS